MLWCEGRTRGGDSWKVCRFESVDLLSQVRHGSLEFESCTSLLWVGDRYRGDFDPLEVDRWQRMDLE